MINSIYLENWRSHSRSTFEFSKGTNVIVGRMGSGKSSIMDAISFALYGTFPARESRRVSLEETIMAKPLKQEKAVVRLDFEYNGGRYSVERTVKRKGVNEATLRESGSGKIIAGPKTTDVTKRICDITEVPFDLFSRAIYSEQNQIDFFLRMSPSERKQKFDELLGLDRYEKARASAVTLQGRVQRTAEDRKKILEEQRKKLDPRQLKELEKRAAEKEKEILENQNEAEKMEKASKEAEKDLVGMVEAEKEHRKLRENEMKAQSRIDSTKEETAKLRKKIENTDVKKIKAELEKALAKINELSAEKSALEKEKLGAEKILSALKERRGAHRSMIEANSKSAQNLWSIKAACPVCKKPMGAHEKDELEKELKEEEVKIGREAAATEKEISSAEALIAKIARSIDGNSEKKEKTQKEADDLKKTAEVYLEICENEKRVSELEKEHRKTLAQISGMKFDEMTLEKKRKEFYYCREKLAKATAELRSGKELLHELQAAVKRIKETGEQARELEKQVTEDERAAEKLSIFTSALKAAQAELRNQMIETINEAMDSIWQRIYPYGDYTTARIMVDDSGYEVMARQLNGEWTKVDGVLSGGERSSAALAMRIAVSLVLTQNLGWIILDEPTHNLDANSVKVLSETMREHLPELIEQVFIITHDKEMENAASGKLYVLEREKGKDGATRIV